MRLGIGVIIIIINYAQITLKRKILHEHLTIFLYGATSYYYTLNM